MNIKQKANCAITIRRFDTGENLEFVQDSIFDVDEATANHLLNMRVYSDGTITDPSGNVIEKGVLCSDFIKVA